MPLEALDTIICIGESVRAVNNVNSGEFHLRARITPTDIDVFPTPLEVPAMTITRMATATVPASFKRCVSIHLVQECSLKGELSLPLPSLRGILV